MTIRRLASFKTPSEFSCYLKDNGVALPFSENIVPEKTALATPYVFDDKTIGNRFAILPMEGWDGTNDGHPTELVRRRWQKFGMSGAKLIWGGEAVAVRMDGRANANQLLINEETLADIADLHKLLVTTHEAYHGKNDDLLVGLQLTHSGRFSCPHNSKRREPFILYHHPILDKKFNLPADYPVMTDDEISRLELDYIHAAALAQKAINIRYFSRLIARYRISGVLMKSKPSY